jgi:integrase
MENSVLNPGAKVGVPAEAWYSEVEQWYRSPETPRLYRDRLDRQVIPSVGNLRIRELTVGTVDSHHRAATASNGPAVAKAVRSVLSGMCRLACTHDALNAIRSATPHPNATKAKRKPRSLSVAEVRQLRAMLTYDDRAIARDLLDFVDMILATGLRIGETAAVQWSSIDLAKGTIDVGTGIVVRTRCLGMHIREAIRRISPRAP